MGFLINPFMVAPGGPQSPSDLANLVRWYKADSFSLSDGTAIGGTGKEWIDQSAGGANLTNSGADQPVFKTNIFGSMPAVRFSTSHLDMPSLTMAGSLTVVLISKKSDTNDSIVLGDQALNTQLRIDYSGLNELALTPVGSTEAISGNFSNASTVLRCQIARRESSVNPNTSEFRENKTYRGGGAFDAGVHNMTWSLVGSAFFGGFNYNGDIAELCIYSQFQTNSDLDALYDNYFKPRWGLP